MSNTIDLSFDDENDNSRNSDPDNSEDDDGDGSNTSDDVIFMKVPEKINEVIIINDDDGILESIGFDITSLI